jgi:competence protein ComEC
MAGRVFSLYAAAGLLTGTAVGVGWRVEDAPLTMQVAVAALFALAAVGAWRHGWGSAGAIGTTAIGLAAGVGLGAVATRAALAAELAALADGEPVVLEGVLRDDAVPTEFGVGCTMTAERARRGAVWRPVAGGMRLTIGGAGASASHGAWRAGRRLRVTATLRRPLPYRNFGTPDQEVRLAWRGTRVFGAVKSAALVEVVARGSWLDEATASARAWARRTVAATIGRDDPLAGAIVLAVLIGDRAGLPPDVEARLQRAGTYHVLAISGGNIAVLAAIVLALVARIGLAPRVRAVVVLGVLGLYAAGVVGGASVARATLAAAVYLAARALDLRTPPLNAVAVTGAMLVAIAPLTIVDVGFWLTVLASLGILCHASRFADRLTPPLTALPAPAASVVRHAAMLAGATLAAEGTVAPVTAYAFGQATLAGLVLNFAAVPLMSVVQVAGMAALGAAAVHPGLAIVPAALARVAAGGIVGSAGLVDAAPWAAWTLTPPPLWLAIAVLTTWWAMWHVRGRTLRLVAAGLWAVGGLALAVGRAPDVPAVVQAASRDPPCHLPALPSDGRWLRVIALDVGQGDATLVRFPDGATWLVDAGGTLGGRFDVGARIVAPALRAQGIRRLEALLLTHADLDHVGGAAGLMPHVPPARVWEGVPVPGLAVLDATRRAASAAGAGWAAIAAGTNARVGGVEVRVLHPPPPDWERRRPRNDDSLVLDLRLGDVSLLLPGDIGPAVEASLVDTLAPVPLRVLKAAHHGSRASSTARFLGAARPAVVVASAGRGNRHGHPDPAVVARVAALGAAFYRTDRDGAIAVDTDGRRVRVTTCAGASAWVTAPAVRAGAVDGGGRGSGALDARPAVLDDERGAGLDRGAGLGDERHHAVVRGPAIAGDAAADVAPLAVVELDVRVLGQHGLEARRHVGAVAAGRDRRADELAADDRRGLLERPHLEVAGEVAVDVAGQDHRVRGPPRAEELHDRVGVGLVGRPLVHRELLGRAGGDVERRHHHLLGEHMPAGGGGVEAREQPVALLPAQDGRVGIPRAVAQGAEPVAAGLRRPVLARVEHREVDQLAVGQAAIERHVRAARPADGPQRHVLEVGLVGGGAPPDERLARLAVVRVIVGVVVLDLVVVPGDDERERRVDRLQIGVGAIEGVALAVALEGHGLGPDDLADGVLLGRVLVDVVAEMDDDVDILLRHVPVGREVPVLPVLAGREREPDAVDVGGRGGRGAGPPDGALPRAGAEAVPVRPRRAQPVDLDVDGVGAQRRRVDGVAGADLREALVFGQLVDDADRFGRHPAAGRERIGRQPRPDHDAVVGGIAGGDAQGERRARELRRGLDRTGEARSRRERKAVGPGPRRGERAGGLRDQATAGEDDHEATTGVTAGSRP